MFNMPGSPPMAGTFYRHSGKVPLTAQIGSLTASVAFAIFTGAIFGFLELYAHLIPFAKLMLLVIAGGIAGMAYLFGTVPTRILQAMHGRSIPAALGLTAVTCAVGMYTAWVFWLLALGIYSSVNWPLVFIMQPRVLFPLMGELQESGVWSMFGDAMVKGPFLMSLWIVEAGGILCGALWLARRKMDEKVYCDHCGRWGEKKTVMQVQVRHAEQLRSELLSGRVSGLIGAKRWDGEADAWCDVELEGCPNCDTLQTLTLDQTVMIMANGSKSPKITVLVKRLVLSPEQSAQVIQAATAAPPEA